MKNLYFTLILILSLTANAQNTEVEKVKNTIIEFFDAFHKQDSVALRAFAKGNIIMQSISVNQKGETILSESNYDQFVKSISNIPKENTFEEKLLDFNIQVDGNMANAWTSYEFWYNGNFSHCGVNSFQLMKEKDDWKIIYLVDTRRREGCQD